MGEARWISAMLHLRQQQILVSHFKAHSLCWILNGMVIFILSLVASKTVAGKKLRQFTQIWKFFDTMVSISIFKISMRIIFNNGKRNSGYIKFSGYLFTVLTMAYCANQKSVNTSKPRLDFLCQKLVYFFLHSVFYCYFRKAFLQKQSVNLSFLTILLAFWSCQS